MFSHKRIHSIPGVMICLLLICACSKRFNNAKPVVTGVPMNDSLVAGFLHPPVSARPGVYWYFMDGNRTKESMTKDLESMKAAGIGNLVFLEVNVGVPRGKVDFLSEEWQEMFTHAVREAERLGIEITLGVGPGWTGSGGPWVSGSQSMQHLVSSSIIVKNSARVALTLPVPAPRRPFFGEGGFTPGLKKQWEDFYEDVAVLAFPTPRTAQKITDIDEKALVYRAPYSSQQGVKQFIPSSASYPPAAEGAIIDPKMILNLTGKLSPDGILHWSPPPGSWTVMRFGVRNNGAVTRPAPLPGLGFEEDKFDTTALNAHLEQYIGRLLLKTGSPDPLKTGGFKKIHMDSWEMGAQNWTANFRAEFIKRRGYDPLPYYPVYQGNIVQSIEVSERFLWDLRQTAQELVLQNHAVHLKEYAHRHGMLLSIEPYDMNPTADLELGAIADIPMCEFWSNGLGYNSSFSCTEATSIAHVNGITLVPAEAFTAEEQEGWKQYPGSMKEQGDWAFAAGINRFVYHTFQSQTLPDNLRPGMTMGPYGVHWDRSQTWWPMVGDYHRYIARCQFMLQEGSAVADILYLAPEGSPQVFRPPSSALTGVEPIRDRREYNFDGCSPGQLMTASVMDHEVVFPRGAHYKVLVLPDVKTMTPSLLKKIGELIYAGAMVIGSPPEKAPGLSGYPGCDEQVAIMGFNIWNGTNPPSAQVARRYGQGVILWGGAFSSNMDGLYPTFESVAALLHATGVTADFVSTAPVRYTHRATTDRDIFFVSNKTGNRISGECSFRTERGRPELWDAITGEIRELPAFTVSAGKVTIPMQFDGWQSFFVVFNRDSTRVSTTKTNFPIISETSVINGPWRVMFDTAWGGPSLVVFDTLTNWTRRPEAGVRYYSGIATYRQTFDVRASDDKRYWLDLGVVKDLARVKLNGKDLGVIWTAPWRVEVTGLLQKKGNQLEIGIANRWPNRLIGDEALPDDGIKDDQWPAWLINGTPRTSGRYTFTTFRHYDKDAPLFSSGLMGPVRILQSE